MRNKVIINLSKDTPPETVSALFAVLKTQNGKGKQSLYLPNEEIEKLDIRYEELYKQVKNSTNLSTEQLNRECEVLLLKYNFELEERSDYYKADYEKRRAQIKAQNDEQIPWRRCCLWRLLGQPVTNRAQDIIEEEAELEADKIFKDKEEKLEKLKGEIYGENGKKLSKRRRKKALKKYLKYKRLLNLNEEAAIERFEAALDKASDNAPPFTEPTEPGKDVAPMENAEQATEPPEPPARKPRKTKQQLGVEPL